MIARVLTALLLLACAAVSMPGSARAQHAVDPTESVLARIDPAQRTSLRALLDSARASSLPLSPMVSKMAEGVSKGADGPRIVQAVRAQLAAMRNARAALGADSNDGEIVAGAAALQAGAVPEMLRRIRAAVSPRPATQALVVLADFSRRGVPRDEAADAVIRLARHGATDSDLDRVRADLAREVEAGAPPGTSLHSQVRRFTAEAPGRSGLPDVRPPVTPENRL